MDDINSQAQNNVGDDAHVATSPVAEPQASPQVESPPDTPVSASAEDQPQERPSRAERRISQLTKKLAEASSPAQASDTQIPQSQVPPWQAPTYQAQQAANETGELTMEQILASQYEIANLAGSRQFQAATAQIQALRDELRTKDEINTLSADFRMVETKYPRLNPDASEYDKAYDDKIHVLYEKVLEPYAKAGRLGEAPRLSEFIDGIEALAQSERSKSQQETIESMAGKVAQGGLSPSMGPEARGDEYSAALAQAKASGRDADWVKVFKLKNQQ